MVWSNFWFIRTYAKVCLHLSKGMPTRILNCKSSHDEKNPTNIFSTFCPKTLNKGAEVHVTCSAVGRESRDGKFPGIPGFFGFPFPGKTWPGSREKAPYKRPQFLWNFILFFLTFCQVWKLQNTKEYSLETFTYGTMNFLLP